MQSVGTYFPALVPTVPPIRTPGIDRATTYQTGVADNAWTSAPTPAAIPRTKTLVATATRGGTRHRTTSWVVTTSVRPVTNAAIVPSATPGSRRRQ